MSVLALNEEQQKELRRCAGIIGADLGDSKTMELLEQKFGGGLSVYDEATGMLKDDRATVFAEGQKSVLLWLKDMIEVARGL